MEKQKLIEMLKTHKQRLLKMTYTPENALVVTSIFMDIEKEFQLFQDCVEQKKCLVSFENTYKKEMYSFFQAIASNDNISNSFITFKTSLETDIEHCLHYFGVDHDQYLR